MERQGEDMPKTLEDAKKLVNSPSLVPDPVKPGIISAIDGALKRAGSENSVQSLMPGNSSQRERSRERTPSPTPLSKAATMPVAGAVAMGESMKNFSSQISRFAGMGVMRGFSKSAVSTPSADPVAATGTGVGGEKGLGISSEEGGKGHSRKESAPVADLLSTFPDLARELKETGSETKESKIQVNHKFVHMEDAGELRLTEVAELLSEYRRLALEVKRRGLAD